MSEVIIYTTPTCPRCGVLKKKMNKKNIKFIECQELNKIIEEGYLSVPILEVDGKYLEINKANDWINKQ